MNRSILLLSACLLSIWQSSFAQKIEWQDIEKKLQTQLIMAEDGDSIHIPAGHYRASGSISMDGKNNIVIMGAGIDKTYLSFATQTEGAEGLRITNCQNVVLQEFTIQDAKGDCIKVMDTQGISFIDMRTEWTGKPKKTNGAYGFYPVSCENVLIDRCEAIGASDAGIYVGQSHNIVVRNSRAYHNVAGIEIENSTMADVYDCEATQNTGGILVFDLPDLPKKKGGNVRVYRNKVYQNDYKNFAPKGNTVAMVPPGTGVMVLATSDVEVFENEILENRSFGLSIISYHLTQTPIKDKAYYPYPTRINIHDNVFEASRKKPTLKSKFGLLMRLKFGKPYPNIIFDGIYDPETLNENGQLKEEFKICIRNNQNGRFAFLDAENNFKGRHQDASLFDCSHQPLSAPSIGK